MLNSYKTLIDSLEIKEQPGTYTQIRISSIISIKAYAGKRLDDEMPALILTADESSLSKISRWPDSIGFKITVEKTPKNTRIYLQLEDKHYEEYFYALCENILTHMEEASEEREAIIIFHNRLVSWQSFFKEEKFDGLSNDAQTGLFGELIVLRDLFLNFIHLDHITTITAWRGCKMANQDFQFKDKAMEVKTTRAAIPEKTNIANVQQLNENGIAPLVLTIVHVVASETAGETLPEIIESIRTKLKKFEARELFEKGLTAVKYLDIHAHKYSDERYELKRYLHHEVKEGFPRLLIDDIPSGVLKVKYQISLSAARDFIIDDERVKEIFG